MFVPEKLYNCVFGLTRKLILENIKQPLAVSQRHRRGAKFCASAVFIATKRHNIPAAIMKCLRVYNTTLLSTNLQNIKTLTPFPLGKSINVLINYVVIQ